MTPEDQDCIAMLQDDLIYNDPLYQQGFQAGAASRDAEVTQLREQLDDMAGRNLVNQNAVRLQKEKVAELREQVALLRDEVTRCRDWFETQAKVNSKGGPSSWELMLLHDERDAAEEALDATEQKP